jgi:hypothetical protein
MPPIIVGLRCSSGGCGGGCGGGWGCAVCGADNRQRTQLRVGRSGGTTRHHEIDREDRKIGQSGQEIGGKSASRKSGASEEASPPSHIAAWASDDDRERSLA